MLKCCHHLCSKCLAKILNMGESTLTSVVCPFCRYVTDFTEEAGGSLPDDYNLATVLSFQNQYLNSKGSQGEIVLDSRHLNSLVGHSASATSSLLFSNYVIITIMESPQERDILADHHSSSLDSMVSVTRRCTVWNCMTLLC